LAILDMAAFMFMPMEGMEPMPFWGMLFPPLALLEEARCAPSWVIACWPMLLAAACMDGAMPLMVRLPKLP